MSLNKMKPIKKIKIGIYTPIGKLEEFGYHHQAYSIIKNITNFADQVLILSSSRKMISNPFSEKNIKFISDNKTWFPVEGGIEKYSFDTTIENQRRAFDFFKTNGFDVYMTIHINQYFSENSVEGIRQICKNMIDQKKPYEWLYKKYQLYDIIFDSDVRVPWIFNLKIDNPYRVSTDSAKNILTGGTIKINNGDFQKFNNRAIMDVLAEFTLEEAKRKYEFTIEKLRKINSTYNDKDKKNLMFIKDEYLQYYQKKINKKIISSEALDKTGNAILSNSQPDFLSNYYKKNYSPIKKQNIFSKLYNKFLK